MGNLGKKDLVFASIRYLPLLAFFVLSGASLYLYTYIKNKEVTQLERLVEREVAALSADFKETIQDEFHDLFRMAKRIELQRRFYPHWWKENAETLLHRSDIFQGIQWIYPKSTRNITVTKNNVLSITQIPSSKRYEIELHAKERSGFILANKENPGSYDYFVPVYLPHSEVAYISGHLTMGTVFEDIELSGYTRVPSDFGLEIMDHEIPVFIKTSENEKSIPGRWSRTAQIYAANWNWNLIVWPLEKMRNSILNRVSLLVLICGLLMSFLSTATIFWALRSLDRARQLRLEMKEKDRFEQDLVASNKKLKKLNSELENFAYQASHDLQAPLRTIIGFSEVLAEELKDRLSPNSKEMFSFIRKTAGQMKELIQDLLKLAKLEIDTNRYDDISVDEVLHEVKVSLSDTIQNNGAIVESKNLPAVYANYGQFVQVFRNLIENALKFQKNGDKPQIRVSAKQVDKSWEFCVEDNGVGIEPQHQKKIFSGFHRLHRYEDVPGTGLGLRLCQRIIHAHHGKIWVESTPGKGSKFYFTIPIREFRKAA